MATADPSYAEGPTSFADLGISTVETTQETLIGKTRSVASLHWCEWTFLAVSLLAILTSLGLTIERLIVLDQTSNDYVYALLLFINALFCLFYTVSGVFREQVYEILVLLVSTVIVTVYVIMNYVNPHTPNTATKQVRLVLTCIMSPVVIGFGIAIAKKYHDSGNFVFRLVGANMQLQQMCRDLFLTLTLLTFDAQLTASNVVLILQDGLLHLTLKEVLVLTIGGVVLILWWIDGYLALRLENKILVYVFLSASPIVPAYVIYEFVMISKEASHISILNQCQYAAGSLALIIRVALVVLIIKCLRNFNMGLKEKVFTRVSRGDVEAVDASQD